jgi:hypothetical protein
MEHQNGNNITIMTQDTINQRIKFLVDTLSPSARAFSEAIQESPTNTFNYIGGRLVEPRASYLTKVILHFGNISAHWLLTGEGEPFLTPPSTGNNSAVSNNKKITRSLVTNNVGRDAIQNHGASGREQALEREIELLKEQLVEKERLIQILLPK